MSESSRDRHPLDDIEDILGGDPRRAFGAAATLLLRVAARLWSEGRDDDAENVVSSVYRLLPEGGTWVDPAAPCDRRSRG